MTTFLQFHVLTEYGPSNPNRDDQGRPKQANVGGAPRLRISSQSSKRAIRESTFFALDLKDHMGCRSKRFGLELLRTLEEKFPDKERDKLVEISSEIQRVFSKLADSADKNKETENKLRSTTLAFVSPEEWKLAETLAEKYVNGEPIPPIKELSRLVLRAADGAIDVAMFGRMLTDETKDSKVIIPRASFSRDAAVQVSHAITTHAAVAEDDWYIAVDDLNKAEDSGAGHLDESGFGSGIYYQYVCVNVDLLVDNLDGDRTLAAKGLEALARAVAMATPTGKQNSYANRPRAYYIRAETGSRQPRDLTGAFFAPIKTQPWERSSVDALTATADNIDRAYGKAYEAVALMDVPAGQGTLDEIAAFAAAAVRSDA